MKTNEPVTRRAQRQPGLASLCATLGVCAGLLAMPAAAQPRAHVHGVLRLDVAVDAGSLVVMVEAPLDSLLGFEHRPRTAAQRRAADDALARMNDAATLWRPDPAARCTLIQARVEAEALQPAAGSAASAPGGAQDDSHAELTASYHFDCAAPAQLLVLEHGLFDAFARLQRIEVQVAGPRGQSRLTLQRPTRVVRLGR